MSIGLETLGSSEQVEELASGRKRDFFHRDSEEAGKDVLGKEF